MDVQQKVAELEIVFTILRDDPSLLEKLSFVHLIKMKFDADERRIGWSKAMGNDPYIRVNLSFPDWSVLSNAYAHCNQCLDDSGSVNAGYRGALDNADSIGRRMAKDLRNRALANRMP